MGKLGDIQKKRATEIALCVRDWLSRNPEVGTIKKLSVISDIPYSTLKKIFSGQRKPSLATVKKLVEYAGVECLRSFIEEPVVPSQLPKDTTVHKDAAKELSDIKGIEQKVRRIIGTFYLLKEQLEFLKGENEQGRDFFRKNLSKRDAAYLVALLQALFSEDEFQRWIYFSEYRTGGTNQ
jgi:hypothetical protein